jgi:hypothetical protein
MFESDFYGLLSGDETLQALLGNSTSPLATRADGKSGIYPVSLPEAGAVPAAIVWMIISGNSIDTMEGCNATGPRRIQIDVYAAEYEVAKAVAAEVKSLLCGYWGILAGGGYLSSVILNLEQDMFEDVPLLFRAILDFSLMYTDAG